MILLLIFCFVVVVPLHDYAHGAAFAAPLVALAAKYGVALVHLTLAYLTLSTMRAARDPSSNTLDFGLDKLLSLAQWFKDQFAKGPEAELFQDTGIEYFNAADLEVDDMIFINQQAVDLITNAPAAISQKIPFTQNITDLTMADPIPPLLSIIGDLPNSNTEYAYTKIYGTNYIFYAYGVPFGSDSFVFSSDLSDGSPYDDGIAEIRIRKVSQSGTYYLLLYDVVNKQIIYKDTFVFGTSGGNIGGVLSYTNSYHTSGYRKIGLVVSVPYTGYLGYQAANSEYQEGYGRATVNQEAFELPTQSISNVELIGAAENISSQAMLDALTGVIDINTGLRVNDVEVSSIPAINEGAISGTGALSDTGVIRDITASTDYTNTISGTLVTDATGAIVSKFQPQFLRDAFFALESMNTEQGAPPHIKINLGKLFNAGVSQVSPELVGAGFADKESTFIDFGMLNEYEFMGLPLIASIRNIIGAGMIFSTINYLRRKILALTTDH